MSIPNGDGTYRRPSVTVHGTVDDVWDEWHRLDQERRAGINRTVTVSEWVTRWLELRRRNVSPTTADTDYYRTLQFVTLYGHVPITEVTAGTVDNFYTHLHNTGRSVTTITGTHATLRKMFNDAVRKNVIQSNPVVGADVPTKRSAPKTVWTPDAVRRFLTGTADHRAYPLFHLALHTGMRREELLGVEWGDIDGDELAIQRRIVTTTDGIQTLPATKNGTAVRTVLLDEATVAVLDRQRRHQTEQLFMLGQRVNPSTPIVTKDDGTRYGPRHVSAMWATAVKDLGIEPRIPLSHARHTWATVALAHGEEVKVVADRLGHSTAMTLDVYAQATTESKRRAAAVMTEAIRKGHVR